VRQTAGSAVAANMTTIVSGPEIVRRLGMRGMMLFRDCQRLCEACSSFSTTSQILLDVLNGRSKQWPTASGAEKLRATVFRSWAQLRVDILSYAEQFAAGHTEHSSQYYDSYLTKLVLSKLKLEETSRPADLAHGAVHSLIREADISELHRSGVAVISTERVASAAKSHFDLKQLNSELELLHRHGAIFPTSSTCSPGTHGVNLRSDTALERANYLKQRTPHMLGAMDFLRALPAALEQAGYRFLDGAERLAVPGVCLVSAYPPGAQYLRHLDCVHVRALTCILYANDDDWDLDRDGGGLVVEPTTCPVAQHAGGGGADGITTFGGEAELPGTLPTREVTPRGGTLVIFESRRVWHAVKPSKRLRFATTLWVYAREVDATPEQGQADTSCAVPTPVAASVPTPIAAHATGVATAVATSAAASAAVATLLPVVGTPLAAAALAARVAATSLQACPLLKLLPRDENGDTAWTFV
jgi:hypothetical protein